MKKIYEWVYQCVDSLWQWIAERVFVRFEFDLPIERIKSIKEHSRIVFTLPNPGIIEFLILSSWCRKQGLGAISVANRRRILLLSNPKFLFQYFFRHKSYSAMFLTGPYQPSLLFCPASERKKPFEPVPVEKLLGEIYANGGGTGSFPIHFFPVFILWKKHVRGDSRKPSEYLLGLSSNPNFVGKMWYLIRARRDSVVRGLGDFPALQSPEGTDAFGESMAMRLAKATRRKILVQTHQEMRVALGPRYLSPPAVKETLLRDPDLQRLIDQIAQERGVDRKKVMGEAYQNLTEIAAKYRYRTIEIFYAVLTWVFTKVFDGLSARDEEFERVREIMKSKAVVFVSCHRSHLDYLVIPYVLFQYDMVTPHIVAGINLAFWPIGSILRSGGAFFIRRSFRGDPLYSLCLKKYIEYLIRNRYNVKFFIEGTRSRSGKMLPPAYGILKMVMEVQKSRAVEDVALIPVSICYDEVPEQSSYTKELSGGGKMKESAKQLIKSTQIIKKNIGKVYVRLGPESSVRDIFAQANSLGADPTLTLQKTAFQLCKTINDITPVTAKSIISSVFIGTRSSDLSLEAILRTSSLFAEYVESQKYPFSSLSMSHFKRTAEQMIKRLQKSGVLTLDEDRVPRVYSLDRKKRQVLNFYKNNAIHCFVRPSIVLLSAFTLISQIEPSSPAKPLHELLIEKALEIRNMLKFDFFFSPTPIFLDEIERDLKFFFEIEDWSKATALDLVANFQAKFKGTEYGAVYARLLGDLIESYVCVLLYLKENPEQGVEKRSFTQKILKFADAINSEGKLVFPESLSIQNYSHAMLLLENLKLASFEADGERKLFFPSPWSEKHEALLNLWRSYLNVMQVDIQAELRRRGFQVFPEIHPGPSGASTPSLPTSVS